MNPRRETAEGFGVRKSCGSAVIQCVWQLRRNTLCLVAATSLSTLLRPAHLSFYYSLTPQEFILIIPETPAVSRISQTTDKR